MIKKEYYRYKKLETFAFLCLLNSLKFFRFLISIIWFFDHYFLMEMSWPNVNYVKIKFLIIINPSSTLYVKEAKVVIYRCTWCLQYESKASARCLDVKLVFCLLWAESGRKKESRGATWSLFSTILKSGQR